MDISELVEKNTREIEALKAYQANGQAVIPPTFVYTKTGKIYATQSGLWAGFLARVTFTSDSGNAVIVGIAARTTGSSTILADTIYKYTQIYTSSAGVQEFILSSRGSIVQGDYSGDYINIEVQVVASGSGSITVGGY